MKKKLIIIAVILAIIIAVVVCACVRYESIDFVTNCEDITYISSSFDDSVNDANEIKRVIGSLNRMVLDDNAPEQDTREAVYEATIHSKGGHTEQVISCGDRMVHYYDTECIGEYRVPLFTQLYCKLIYGSID